MFIIRHIRTFLILAGGITLAAVIALIVFGLPLGIDFTGGSLTEVSYTERPAKEVVEEALTPIPLGGYSLREATTDAGEEAFILRTRDLTDAERQEVSAALTSLGEGGEVDRFTSIGPVIGEELKDKAGWAVGLVALVIVLYVAFTFRGVRRPVRSWVYGLIVILVLLHDVLVPTALFGVLGHVAGAEVDVLFVMAILAVLGYSVNDTIVVFDRVRENLKLNEAAQADAPEAGRTLEVEPFAETVGRSVSQTFTRSINTSFTTLLALVALYVIGGAATQNFALVLIAGVVAGTYSSLFIAPPLLVALERWQQRKASKA